ncbi:hypothetical protein HC02_17955 [Vibrio parahaemolyticus]|nr:hypothetical protein HC02_17955 [Vibrio parahaemolyticus]
MAKVIKPKAAILRALNIFIPLTRFAWKKLKGMGESMWLFPSASSQADRNFRCSLSALNQFQREQEDRCSNAGWAF